LILREVLGFSARETAQVLQTTPVSVDSALQRAHRTVVERVPARSQQETLRSLGDGEVREIVNRFAEAWESHDINGLVEMLVEDVRMTMPPQPSWYQGRDAVELFLGRWPLTPEKRFRLVPITASGQPALAAYIWNDKANAFEAESIVVLTLDNGGIEEITAFRSPELFARFSLPEQTPDRPS
jgi:RNA polymerase sigma-70 factor, ECF subfamily